MRICTKCKREYPATGDHFPPNKKSSDGLSSWCRECGRKLNKAWRTSKKGKSKYKAINKRYEKTKKGKALIRAMNLKYNYGITLAQYDEMFNDQNGVCAICGLPSISHRLSVDHDHKTGKVRGLLCHPCNMSLGVYEKRKDKFEDYLREHK